MNDETIELSIEAARGVVPCLEAQIESLDSQIENLVHEREKRVRSLTELRARLDGAEASLAKNGAKRLRKGEAERIIYDLLNSLPEHERGISIQEVVKRSGVPYTSAFRILNRNKKGHFDNPEGFWRVKAKK